MSKSEQARQPLREKMEARESDFIQKYRQKAGWFRSLSISRKIKKLKTAVEHRELMRLHRTRIFGLVRSYYLEIGSRLRDWGALRSPTDVFYLTRDEIFDCFYGKSASRDLRALVDLRMKESQEFEKIEMPAQVEVPQPVSWMMGKIEPERPAFCPSGNLKGLGCSQGKVRAKVRFVRTPQEAQNLDNCILLAERTDPGWTPLFTLVRGVIIERGSALSHSAIIAREMGIPAVVGVPGVTKILHDGDEVEIDGSSGRIEIIQNSAREARTLSTDLAVAK